MGCGFNRWTQHITESESILLIVHFAAWPMDLVCKSEPWFKKNPATANNLPFPGQPEEVSSISVKASYLNRPGFHLSRDILGLTNRQGHNRKRWVL